MSVVKKKVCDGLYLTKRGSDPAPWLLFESPEGLCGAILLNNISDSPIVRDAIMGWAEDKLKQNDEELIQELINHEAMKVFDFQEYKNFALQELVDFIRERI